MAAATTGRLTDGAHKGWRYQVYPDPSSPTGYVRKIWDPTDASNGGKPTEFFSNYDYAADQEDAAASDQKSQDAAATKAAKAAQAAAATSAFNTDDAQRRQEIADESARRFGVTSDLTKSGQQTQLDVAKVSRDTQLQMAKDRLKEDARQHDLDQAEKAREFGLTNGLAQQQLGADVLKTASSLRGPLDFVQGDAYAQGVSNGGLSPFVAALRGGTPVQFGGATGTQGSPTPLTVGTLANVLTGQGATSTGAAGAPPMPGATGAPPMPGTGGLTPLAAALRGGGAAQTDAYGRPALSPDVQAAVDAGRQTYESGLANKGLGFEENMTTGQKAALHSIGDYLGRDTASEDQYYNRSRPGQGSAMAA